MSLLSDLLFFNTLSYFQCITKKKQTNKNTEENAQRHGLNAFQPFWASKTTARKTKKPHPCLSGHGYVRKIWIAENQTVFYQLQTWVTPGLYWDRLRFTWKTQRNGLAKVQIQEGLNKRIPREEEAVIKALTAPSPMKNDCGEVPLRIFETTVLIFPPPSLFLSWGPAARLVPPISSCDRDKLCSRRSNLVGEQDLGYCSQLMKKQQLQSLLVCQFSQNDPHPAKIILKFTLLMGAPEKMEWLEKKKKKSPVGSSNKEDR